MARRLRRAGRRSGRPPTLEEARDAVMSDTIRDILQDRAARRRLARLGMGFSARTVTEIPELVEAYLEDLSRYHHGVDPHKSGSRKAGRRRQRGRPWRRRDYPNSYSDTI